MLFHKKIKIKNAVAMFRKAELCTEVFYLEKAKEKPQRKSANNFYKIVKNTNMPLINQEP